MKKLIITCLFFVSVLYCFAEPIDKSRAIKIAVNCISSSGKQSFSFSQIEKQSLGESSFYIVKFNPTGFVVVSGDDRFYPVLFYSTECNYDVNNIPPGFKMMMDNYSEQLQYAVKNYIAATDEIKKSWAVYENQETALKKTGNIKEVLPLIKTKWAQTYPYNKYCPKATSDGSSGRAYAGCVAVALAQLLKYYEWPKSGKGSNSYELLNYGTVSANFFNTVYSWSNIANTLQNETDTVKINETAKLIYQSGVAVNTDFSGLFSGASFIDASSALSNYFFYSPGIYLLKNYNSQTGYVFTEEEWMKQIKEELDNKRPILYKALNNNGGDSHVFLIDGYDINNYLHVNWGWGGSFDGYYLSIALSPGNFNFSLQNEAIFRISKITPSIIIKSPSNNDNPFPHLYNSLVWNYSLGSGNTRYKLVIAKDINFYDVVLDSEIIGAQNISISSICDYGTKYYWKVGTYLESNTILWTNIYCFTTAGINGYKPVCTYPQNNKKNVELYTSFTWYIPSSIPQYKNTIIQIATDPLFSKIIFQKDTNKIYSISTSNLKSKQTYYWRVGIVSIENNIITWSDAFSFSTILSSFEIYNNFPNPFNKSTIIYFKQHEEGSLSIKIYNSLGQEVRKVFENFKGLTIGIEWTPKNLPSGIYYCWIKFNDTEKIIKLNYLK